MDEKKISVGAFRVGMIQTNCYFVYREDEISHNGTDVQQEKTPCVVFDPGDSGKQIYDALLQRNLKPELILLTHGHFDHIGGAAALREESGAAIKCFQGEKRICSDPEKNLSADYGNGITIQPDEYLEDLAMVEAAGIRFQLIATPGHTEGSCGYYCEEGNFVISGDTLFHGSVGRTDMPTGSMSQLVSSVRERLFALPDDTVIYPGHDSSSSIGFEKENNPFV